MRALIAIGSLALLASCSGVSTHSSHNWQKEFEQPAQNGEMLCQWKCTAPGDFGGEHVITTSGYGMCPTPSLF